mgnify:CR=1 FL=1
MFAQTIVEMVAPICTEAVPIALCLGLANALISMFVRVAIGGTLTFKG